MASNPARILQTGFSCKPTLSKPSKTEIESFYKAWWQENFMVPLNKAPMGVIDCMSAFYDTFCTESDKTQDS